MRKGFFTLIGLLLAIIIIFILIHLTLKVPFQRSPVGKKSNFLSGQDTGSGGYESILDRTKAAVEEHNRRVLERQKQYDNF